MTTQQKVGQLLITGLEGCEAGEDGTSAVQDYQVGGMILFGRNVESAEQLVGLTNELKTLNGDAVPLFLAVDQEGGRVSRMPAEIERLPAPLTVGQSGDAGLAEQYGTCLGELCGAFGFNVDFAPCLDIWSNPENTVIGDRAFGTDASAAAALGNAAAEGIAAQGVIPVVKHFPGHGDTAVDSHVGLPVVEKSLEELEAQELIPFQEAIDRGAPAIMAAHILEKGIDPDAPASLSYKVVTGLLRERMGFDGVVFTDDLTMGAVSETYGMGEAAVLAVEAGCDMLLVCHGTENLAAAYEAILSAVESGRISRARLDESVYRILSLKVEYGLTNAPSPEADVESLDGAVEALLEALGT